MHVVADPTAAVTRVRAERISTDGRTAGPVEEEVCVVREGSLTIDVQEIESFTLLCTPNDREALTVGFLLSEGLIERLADVAELRPCHDQPEVVRVRLARPARVSGEPGRNLVISSSCGMCGTEDLAARLAALPAVGDALRLRPDLLRTTCQRVRDRQVLFDACGGTHAVALFGQRGELLSLAEDTGRHNALDKAIGRCLLDGVATAGSGAVLSGRVSLEMVVKCARAGIELIAAVSAPTSLALEVAERCNITLCAFVRETRATVFTHPRRVIEPTEPR